MLRLRKILLCNYLYYLILLLAITYTVITVNTFQKPKLDINSNVIIGKVETISLDESKLTLIIKNKEKVKATYYITKKQEFSLINKIHLGDKVKLEGEASIPLKKKDKYSFDYERYLKTKKIYYLFKIEKLDVISSSRNIFYKLKEFVINRCKNKYLKVFILGDKSSLDSKVIRNYQDLGISHLFALSGMHVSLLSTMIIKILEKLKIKEDNRLRIVSFILVFYLFITGFSASILRAILFFICFSLNKIYYTYIDSKNIFLFVLAISLFINPFYIYDVAFIYSYSISFSLIVMANFINSFKSYFKSLFITSIISFLVGIPTSLYFFNQLNFLSIIYNLLYVPFISYIVFPLSLISFLIPQSLKLFELFTYILEFSTNILTNISFFKLIFCSSNIFLYLIYVILIIFILKKISLKKKKELILLILLLIFHYLIPTVFDKNYLMMIDVGQGDSILIHSKRKSILIDTGGIENSNSKVVLNKTIPLLKKLGISKIDYLVLTHGDFDHAGEAINLIRNFKVDKIYLNQGNFNFLEKQIILNHKRTYQIAEGDLIKIGNISLTSLNKAYDDENDSSTILLMHYKNIKVLLTGDASVKSEKYILDTYDLGHIDILKLGHHGSKTSTSEGLLRKIRPNLGLISCGKDNKFNHPHQEIIERLKKYKIKYLRTDIEGTIKIDLDTLKIG